MSQLRLFPQIRTAQGQEWIYAEDSTGYSHNFTREQGASGPFYNRFAGQPRHPRSGYGPGECVNEYGRLIDVYGEPVDPNQKRDHQLAIYLGDKAELAATQRLVEKEHYLHQQVHPQARPMVYLIERSGQVDGLIMVSTPHATRCRGWWGYPDLPTQWQVVDLCRIWLHPSIQTGGYACKPGLVPGFTDRNGVFRPTTPTWAMEEVLKRVQRDRVSEWPPVFPAQPYHIRLAISYHDPAFHRGTIYRQGGWQPMYADEAGNSFPGARGGKYGWCRWLPEPDWAWDEIEIRRPRTMRFEFA